MPSEYIKSITSFLDSPQVRKFLSYLPKYSTQFQFDCDLKEHQQYALAYLYKNSKCILADEMRLGKSVTIIALFELLKNMNKAKKILIIMPDYLKINFKFEIEKWVYDSKVLIIKTKADLNKIDDNDYILINYDKFRLKDFDDFDLNKYDIVVLDEAHRFNLKSLKAGATLFKSSITMLNLYNKLQKYNNRLIFMTGSPLTKSFSDMFGMLKCILPKKQFNYDSYKRFADDFCFKNMLYVRKNKYPLVTYKGLRPDKLEYVKKLINPYVLRRRLSEVYDSIGQPIETVMMYDGLNGTLSHQIADFLKTTIDNKINDKDIIDSFDKKDLSSLFKNHFEVKKEAVCNFIDDLLLSYNKILVLNHFKSSQKYLYEKYNDISMYIDGDIDSEERLNINNQFRKNDKTILFATIGSIAEGLDLSYMDCILFTQPWVEAGKMNQVIMRCSNINRQDNYNVYFHIINESFEDIIYSYYRKNKALIIATIDQNVNSMEESHLLINENLVKKYILK